MLLDENAPTPAASRIPIDLTATPSASAGSASPSPNKIQKSSKKPFKTAPEQVTRALNSIPEFHQQGLQYGTPPIMGPYNPHAQMTGYSYNAANTALPNASTFPTASTFPNVLGLPGSGMATPHHGVTTGNFHPSPFPPSMLPPVGPMPAQIQGSCCSNSHVDQSDGVNTDHPSIYQPAMQPIAPMPVEAQGSCCSSSYNGSPTGIKTEPNAHQNEYPMSPLAGSPVASSSSWQGFPSMDGHISAIDGNTNGFQPDFSGITPHIPHQNYTNSTSIDFKQDPVPQPDRVKTPEVAHPSLAANTSGVSHSCNCGPNCNCFACPDHPYNDVTVQHVQEMGRIIAQDSQTSGQGSNHQTSLVNGFHPEDSQTSQPSTETQNYLKSSFDPVPSGNCCGSNNSPLENGHDTQTLDTFTADHLMVPDAYYTYEYQVGLPGACAGEVGNCQCGPSCSCLGCLTHGNP